MNARFFAVCISILLTALVICFAAGCTSSIPGQSASGDPSAQRETAAPEVKETPVTETEAPIVETEEPVKEEPTEEPKPTPVVLIHALWKDPDYDWDSHDDMEYNRRLKELLDQYYAAEPMVDSEPLNIPFYYDSDTWYPYMFGFSYDSVAFVTRDFPLAGLIDQYTMAAFRKTSDKKAYFVIGWENGNRWYSFLKDNNGEFAIREGFSIIINEVHAYDDFKNIKIGDTIDDVCAVDSVAELYKSWAEQAWVEDPEIGHDYLENISFMMKANEEKGAPFSSIHYLSDGILLFQYHRNENNEMVIKNIIYSEDYKLPDMLGREVDYRILDIDLP